MIDLRHGDCLELMKDISDCSIDLILADPPYGTTACKWDSVIPFEPMWEQLKRVIKPNGAIALFGSEPFKSLLVCSNITNFREELIWLKNKPASGMQAKQKHMKIHENICVFSYNSKYTYNPQKWLVEDKEFLTQRKTFKSNEYIGNQIYGATRRTRKPDAGERNPISVLSCKTPITPAKSKTYKANLDLRVHPTQKPVPVLEYLIKTYTNPGETVLDFTMGSGSTGVACVNTNRNFIGIELDDNYFSVAQERTNKAIKDKEKGGE